MKAVREKKASPAQARFLARAWGLDECVHIGTNENSTIKALIAQKWLEPTFERGEFPSGDPWVGHRVCHAGELALERFLWEARVARRQSP
jgi:hypothetical protein